jgi:hypothetical protein
MRKRLPTTIITTLFLLTGCSPPTTITRQPSPSPSTVQNVPQYYLEGILSEYQRVQENLKTCRNKSDELELQKKGLKESKDGIDTYYTGFLTGGGALGAGTTIVLSNISPDDNSLYNALTIVFASLVGISKFFIDGQVKTLTENITNIETNNFNIAQLVKNVETMSLYLDNREYLEKLNITELQDTYNKLKDMNSLLSDYCENLTKDKSPSAPTIQVVPTPGPTPTSTPTPAPVITAEPTVTPTPVLAVEPAVTPTPTSTPSPFPTSTATPSATVTPTEVTVDENTQSST